jgi:hypothetical protein
MPLAILNVAIPQSSTRALVDEIGMGLHFHDLASRQRANSNDVIVSSMKPRNMFGIDEPSGLP